jgi:D-amino-acid dehydrogenase
MTGVRVGIVGAGIIGASCALTLARQGHQVFLLEPETPGGPHAASHGNGGWISPTSIIPMATPGLWKKIPGYLLDPMGPLTLRPTSLPHLLSWLWQFVRAGSTVQRVRNTTTALHQLLQDAPERHREMAQWADATHLLHHQGLLYAYPDRHAFAQEAQSWQWRREHGLNWIELEGDALHAQAPALHPDYRLGVWVPSAAWCSDPGQYVQHLVAAAQRHGARLIRTTVHRLRLQQGRCDGVDTSQGSLALDQVLIASGIRSRHFAQQAGDRLPMASERGYHVVLPHAALELPVPVMPSDGRMANTPMTSGLRLAGQVELAHPDAPPNWARADVLLGHARRCYPALQDPERCRDAARWMGHRPSTPDGLPVIGPSPRHNGLWYACGHGHVGLAAAARTGLLMAEFLRGQRDSAVLTPWQIFGLERFER